MTQGCQYCSCSLSAQPTPKQAQPKTTAHLKALKTCFRGDVGQSRSRKLCSDETLALFLPLKSGLTPVSSSVPGYSETSSSCQETCAFQAPDASGNKQHHVCWSSQALPTVPAAGGNHFQFCLVLIGGVGLRGSYLELQNHQHWGWDWSLKGWRQGM